MKAKNIAAIVMLVLFLAGSGLLAQSDSADVRPYIGVLLDTTPLPDLLVKHLGLSPGQGIRIQNVHRGGPADKAGLERVRRQVSEATEFRKAVASYQQCALLAPKGPRSYTAMVTLFTSSRDLDALRVSILSTSGPEMRFW